MDMYWVTFLGILADISRESKEQNDRYKSETAKIKRSSSMGRGF